MTDRLIPEPRPEVVELFEDVLMCKAEDPEAQALFDSRFWWTTGTERRAGYDGVIAHKQECLAIVQETRDITAHTLDVLSARQPTVDLSGVYDDE